MCIGFFVGVCLGSLFGVVVINFWLGVLLVLICCVMLVAVGWLVVLLIVLTFLIRYGMRFCLLFVCLTLLWLNAFRVFADLFWLVIVARLFGLGVVWFLLVLMLSVLFVMLLIVCYWFVGIVVACLVFGLLAWIVVLWWVLIALFLAGGCLLMLLICC